LINATYQFVAKVIKLVTESNVANWIQHWKRIPSQRKKTRNIKNQTN